MKTMILTTIVMLTATLAQAASINSEKISIKPSAVDKVIRLVDKQDQGSAHKKLSVVVTDNGLSTDVSPRYRIQLGYQSNAEMGNISADFLISGNVWGDVSAKRISGGIYEVKATEYRDDDFYTVTYKIDATKMFSDENAARKACGEDFCDLELKTSIQVKETAKKQTPPT